MAREGNQISKDIGLEDFARPLTATTDPILARLWDNKRDAAYDHDDRALRRYPGLR